MAGSRTRTVPLRSFIAGAAAGNVSLVIQWMSPLLMSYLVTQKGVSAPAAGTLLTAEMGASAIAAVIVARWIRPAQAQAVALWGVTLTALASGISLYVHGFAPLLAARSAVGLAAGMTIMVSNVVAANFSDPDRYFAQLGMSNLVYGFLMVGAVPYLHSASPYAITLLAVLTLIPLMALMPKGVASEETGKDESSGNAHSGQGALGRNVLLLVGVTFIVNVSSGMLWSLYGLIGEQSALSSEVVNSAIDVSIGAGAIGALLAAFLGSSLGRIGPFCVALLLMTGAILVLTSHPNAAAFRFAVCVNVGSIFMILPYMAGLSIALDPQGKAATYVSGSFFAATALSPLVAGVLITTVGIEAIGRLILMLSIVSAVTYIYVARNIAAHRNGAVAPAPVE